MNDFCQQLASTL